MKPSLAIMLALGIVLAVAALTIDSATVAPISNAAVAEDGKPDRWCGTAACAPRDMEPATYR